MHFATPHDALTYALAGKAKLTLTSRKTEKWYTYKVDQLADRVTGEPQSRWFVALLSGPENTADYTYVGTIGEDRVFRLTKASKFAIDSTPVRAFNYFWRNAVEHHRIPADLEVRHEGSCGVCGRPLTVPASIDRGIGPECSKRIGH